MLVFIVHSTYVTHNYLLFSTPVSVLEDIVISICSMWPNWYKLAWYELIHHVINLPPYEVQIPVRYHLFMHIAIYCHTSRYEIWSKCTHIGVLAMLK